MEKVIAWKSEFQRVITTEETAQKNKWRLTHKANVTLLDKADKTPVCTNAKPETADVITGINGRKYRIESLKALEQVCHIDNCTQKARWEFEGKLWCDFHYRTMVITRPIKRKEDKPNRNVPCPCGSGMKFKNCCLKKRNGKYHYFNSMYKQDTAL